MAREQGRKVIARNRRAYHDYRIEDTYEAGLVLTGTEVKSLRAGRASLQDGFAQITGDEVWLHNVHIPEYTEGTWTNHTPRRIRKLLLHRKEIDRLVSKTAEQGLTLIPLSLYFRDGNVKVELGLARGKRTYDKRQDLAKRDAVREMDRAMKRRRLRAGGSCPLRRASAAATPGRGATSCLGQVTTRAPTDPAIPARPGGRQDPTGRPHSTAGCPDKTAPLPAGRPRRRSAPALTPGLDRRHARA